MATRSSDVNLVIRARDEATKGIESVTDALNNLFGSQEKVAGSSAKTGTALTQALAGFASLDKAVAGIVGATDRAENAFDSMASNLLNSKVRLSELRIESDYAADALANLQKRANAGPQIGGLTPILTQMKAASAASDTLANDIRKLEKNISDQEAALSTTKSALQELTSVEISAKDAREVATAQIADQTRALRDQAEAARALAAIRSSQYQDSGKSAEISGSVFESAGLTRTEKQIAATEQLVAEEARLTAELNEQTIARRNASALAAIRSSQYQDSGKSAEISGSVFESAGLTKFERETADELRRMDDAAAALRAELNPLAAAQERFNQKLREAKTLYQSGKISLAELGTAQAKYTQLAKRAEADIARNGKEGGVGIFGLRPYEVTNLGYQINDLVTQISSGTSVTQAFAQQGGQILQLFPRISAGIAGAFTSPPILLFAGALVAVGLGLKEIGDRAERLRDFSASLTALADGATYSADALAKSVEVARRYGTTAADATAALKTFTREGIAPERLDEFTRTAQNMADVLGIKVPEAAKQLADGFNGGYDAVVKLDEATGFLTASQREHIRALFETGRAEEARAEAFKLFADRQEDAAQKTRGPWTDAVRALSGAWQSFLDALANSTVLNATAGALETLAGGVTTVLKALSGSEEIRKLTDRITGLQNALATAINSGSSASDAGVKALISRIEALQAERQALIDGVAKSSRGDTLGDGANSETAKRRSERLAEIARQREADGQKKLDGARRVSEAGRLAFEAEMRRSGDAKIAQAEKELAVSREKAIVDKEAAALAEKRLREGATSAGASKNLIMEREGFRSRAYWDRNAYRVGYGSDTVTGPTGTVSRVSATTTTTKDAALVDLERRIKEFQDVIKRQVGNDRFSSFSPQQQAALTSVAYNYGSLPDRIINAVKTGTASEIAAAVRGLGGDNKGINRARRNREAGLIEAAPNAELDQNNVDRIKEAKEKQDGFNDSLAKEGRQRELNTDLANQMRGLSGDALINAQREAAVQQAIQTARERSAKDNLKFTDAQIAALRKQVELEFEATKGVEARAKAARDAVDRPVADLTGQRDALQNQIDFLRDNNQANAAKELLPILDQVNGKLRQAITNAIEFYKALKPNDNPLGLTKEQIEAIIIKLQIARDTSKEWGVVLGISARQIAEAFASTVTAAVDKFAKSLAEGKNVFKSLKDAFLDFASSFLRQIAQMIIQQIAFNIAKGILSSTGVGVPGLPVPTNHTGGIAGMNRTETRTVNPAWFAGAIRMHTGGIAGLKPNEVPTILEKGEEVLTRSDARHRDNIGRSASSGGGGSLKVVNVFDAGAAVEEALNTPAGEKAILNHVRNNPQAWKAALGTG